MLYITTIVSHHFVEINTSLVEMDDVIAIYNSTRPYGAIVKELSAITSRCAPLLQQPRNSSMLFIPTTIGN